MVELGLRHHMKYRNFKCFIEINLLNEDKESSYTPQGHDCCCQRNTGDGIEIGKMREHKMGRGEDHDKVSKLDIFAIFADQIMEFLERFPSSNHVNYVHSNLDN